MEQYRERQRPVALVLTQARSGGILP